MTHSSTKAAHMILQQQNGTAGPRQKPPRPRLPALESPSAKSLRLTASTANNISLKMAMQLPPGAQTLRFRQPSNQSAAMVKTEEGGSRSSNGGSSQGVDKFGGQHAPDANKWRKRHLGLLQDLVGRTQNGPIIPSFSLALRMLLLIRVGAAMYSNIQDCDEVFNFFEPLHYFSFNWGFQTWELSPEFAIRSWAYVLLHWPMAHAASLYTAIPKRTMFFSIRCSLGAICALCEATFYRAVVEHVNERVGRYMLFAMVGSAGMWGASTAFLPSSFAMYTTLLAYSYFLKPAVCNSAGSRAAYLATFFFALGAIVGWPFSVLVALPFIVEQLFVYGEDVVSSERWGEWVGERWGRLVKAAAAASLIAIPVILIDSLAYGRTTFPTLNILTYNLTGSSSQLYGTSPWHFYFLNLFINFNFLFLLALVSLPLLVVTYLFDHRRLALLGNQKDPKPDEGSPYALLALRLAGMYLWLGFMSVQSHKEERFMFPVYGLICFNGSVSVYLVKGLVEKAFIKITSSSYRAGQTRIFSNIALALVTIPILVSFSRVFALAQYYHAPLSVIHHFSGAEVPRILAKAGYSPVFPAKKLASPNPSYPVIPAWNITQLVELEHKPRLCWGREWYRYPSSWLVPEGVDVRWIESKFDGAIPQRWVESEKIEGRANWRRAETRIERAGRFNGKNEAPEKEEAYVHPATCDYLIDLALPSDVDLPHVADVVWSSVYCVPFLDANHSKWWTRVFYLPGDTAEQARAWGKYCLLKSTRKEIPR